MKTQLFVRCLYLACGSSAMSLAMVFAPPALLTFKTKRENGNESDRPSHEMPQDGKYTWIKGEVRSDGYVYGVKRPDGNYDYEVRYDAGPGDKAWMEEKDKNYLARIEREGNLKKLEPTVWYLRQKENATANIRDWWTEKLKLPNLPQILEEAEKEAKQFACQKIKQGPKETGASTTAKAASVAFAVKKKDKKVESKQVVVKKDVVKAKALYDYPAEQDGDLSFKAGDIITVKDKSKAWWTGVLRGVEGVFPGNYVELISDNSPIQKAQEKKGEEAKKELSGKTDPVKGKEKELVRKEGPKNKEEPKKELSPEMIKKEKVERLKKLISEAKQMLLSVQIGGKLQLLPQVEQIELKSYISYLKKPIDTSGLSEQRLNKEIEYVEGKNKYLLDLSKKIKVLEEEAKFNALEAELTRPKTSKAIPPNITTTPTTAPPNTTTTATTAVTLPTATPMLSSLTQFRQIPHNELQLMEKLGQGGFGVVYKATWHQELVAVKELHTPKLTDSSKEEFVNETRTMAKLNYPRIVQLYGICIDPCCLVMEYLPRGSLYSTLHSQAKYPWVVSLQISHDIGCGLAFLHQAKIIHRDLKSANVLLDNNFRAKICDFGLSRTKNESSKVVTKSTVGTMVYISPEIFDAETGTDIFYTCASDVYAYGIILWEIVAKPKIPWDKLSPSRIIANVVQGKREEIPICPPSYSKLIDGCWAQKPEDRPSALVVTKNLEQQIQEAQSSVVRSWHCDPAAKPNTTTGAPYYLVDATEKDKQKVVEFYQRCPVSSMGIKSVRTIYNLEFNRAFAAKLVALEARHNNPGFTPKWPQENNPQWRQATLQSFEQKAAPYKDSDYPNVKIIAMWHGTNPQIFDSIFRAGYANLASTDPGFYGKGIYGSYEAEYANRAYSKGALLVNWMALYSAYPVIGYKVIGDTSQFQNHGDMLKLMGKGNYHNYDAHFIPVKPDNPLDPNEVNYYPCHQNEPAIYHELVVFESAQCIPRYIIELQPNLPKMPRALPNLPKASCAMVSTTTKTTTTGYGSFWHFRCKHNNGLTFFGKSRATKEEAEQALRRHWNRKHGNATIAASAANVEQTTTNHPKMHQ